MKIEKLRPIDGQCGRIGAGDGGSEAGPLRAEGQKLKTALHALMERWRCETRRRQLGVGPRERSRTAAHPRKAAPAGHGRNGASAFTGARKVGRTALKAGHPCPECGGKSISAARSGVLVRVKGQAPIAATVYELERCGAICAQMCLRRRRRKAWARSTRRRPA